MSLHEFIRFHLKPNDEQIVQIIVHMEGKDKGQTVYLGLPQNIDLELWAHLFCNVEFETCEAVISHDMITDKARPKLFIKGVIRE